MSSIEISNNDVIFVDEKGEVEWAGASPATLTICVCNVADSAYMVGKIINALHEMGINASDGTCWVNDLGGIQETRPCPAKNEEWNSVHWALLNEAISKVRR